MLDYNHSQLGHKILYLCSEVMRDRRTLGKPKTLTCEAKKEIVTETDEAVEEAVIDYFREEEIPVNLDGEEKRRTIITENPQGLVVLDPDDGTFNYFRGYDFSLPHCSIATIFDSPDPQRIGDAVWAGIYEHTTRTKISFEDQRVWIQDSNGLREIKTSGRTSLEGKAGEEFANIMLDYGPKKNLKMYKPFSKIISKSWTKNISCAGMHLAGVATGTFDAYICPVQKPEELVAGIPLIERAGGAVINFQGDRLANKPYDFNARYKVIAAATPELAEEIKSLIARKSLP